MTPHEKCNCKESPAACPIADMELAVAFSDAVQDGLEAEVAGLGRHKRTQRIILDGYIANLKDLRARITQLEEALQGERDWLSQLQQRAQADTALNTALVSLDDIEGQLAALAPQEECRCVQGMQGCPVHDLRREPTGEPECDGSGYLKHRNHRAAPGHSAECVACPGCPSCTKGEADG